MEIIIIRSGIIKKSHVLISSAMAQKYSLKDGDKFLADDPQSDRMYAFTVDGIVDYTPAFYIFMDIDSMRGLFGADDEYYNVVFSDHKLDIDAGRLYSVSSRADVIKAADIFNDLMFGLVITMIAGSAIILAIVMYLMMKVMIDRSAQGISRSLCAVTSILRKYAVFCLNYNVIINI